MLGGSFQGGKKMPLALVSPVGPSPLLSFTSVLFLSIQHYMRGPSQSVFVGRRGGGFGETTPSLNPPTAVDSKLKKVLLQTPISGLHWEANFKLQSKDDSVGGEKKKKKKEAKSDSPFALKEQTAHFFSS